MKRPFGFTLIELLVVIAIIAMLLAILMPVLSSVKDRSQRVVCSAHMHNIGLMMHIYGSENNSHLPTGNSLGSYLFDLPHNVANMLRKEYQLETIYCPANTLRKKNSTVLNEYFTSHMNNSDPDQVTSGWAVSDYFWLMTFGNTWRKIDNDIAIYNTLYPSGTSLSGKRIFAPKTTMRGAAYRPLVVDLVFTQSAGEPRDFSEVMGGLPTPFSSNHLKGTRATGGNVLNCDVSVVWKDFKEMELNYTGQGNTKYYG